MELTRNSRLQKLLDRALAPRADVRAVLFELSLLGERVKTEAEAEGVVLLLERAGKHKAGAKVRRNAYDVISLFQNVATKKAGRVLREKGMPVMERLYDRTLQLNPGSDDLLFILRTFCAYRWEPGLDRLIAAARNGLQKDAYPWEFVFRVLGTSDLPAQRQVLAALTDHLPKGFCLVAFLDYANTAARQHNISPHPFDTPTGRRQLGKWIASRDKKQFSYAHSAAAALPFISPPDRERLLDLAMNHASAGVQMEAAWAASRLGSDSGVKLLARYCSDAKHATTAKHYLEELRRLDAIPASGSDPTFKAMSEMNNWLASPFEFGRPPDKIELYDTRTLFWPPTNDRRDVWLFKYVYKANKRGKKDDVGLGMVGSVTFALFGQVTADLSPEEAYGLHCCWELECMGDPRAPKVRSVEAGRQLMRQQSQRRGSRGAPTVKP